MPHLEDFDPVRGGGLVDDDIGSDRHEFAGAWNATSATAGRKDRETIPCGDPFPRDLAGGDRVFFSDLCHEAKDIGARRCLLDDHQSERGSGGTASKFPAAISSNQARISACGTPRRSARAAATAAVNAASSAASSSRRSISGTGFSITIICHFTCSMSSNGAEAAISRLQSCPGRWHPRSIRPDRRFQLDPVAANA